MISIIRRGRSRKRLVIAAVLAVVGIALIFIGYRGFRFADAMKWGRGMAALEARIVEIETDGEGLSGEELDIGYLTFLRPREFAEAPASRRGRLSVLVNSVGSAGIVVHGLFKVSDEGDSLEAFRRELAVGPIGVVEMMTMSGGEFDGYLERVRAKVGDARNALGIVLLVGPDARAIVRTTGGAADVSVHGAVWSRDGGASCNVVIRGSREEARRAMKGVVHSLRFRQIEWSDEEELGRLIDAGLKKNAAGEGEGSP